YRSRFYYYCDRDPRDLHSFPTRRSSDLLHGRAGRLAVRPCRKQSSWESVPRNQIEGARSGRPKGCAPRVFAHREELRIVPHRGGGVAVVVAHGAGGPEHFVVAAQLFDELVHQAAVRSRLFIVVIVVLVAGHGQARGDSEWIQFVGIVGEQPGRQESVGFRSVVLGVEGSPTRQVKGVRIGAKIIVERNVFLKDYYDMLNWRTCEKPSLVCADAGYTGKRVIAEAATTAMALVRRRCMGSLSLEFTVLNH